MTIDRSITWTQQHRYLWTGRIDGVPGGTIERGARYSFIDISGAEHHGFRTLEEAEAAAQHLLLESAGEPADEGPRPHDGHARRQPDGFSTGVPSGSVVSGGSSGRGSLIHGR